MYLMLLLMISLMFFFDIFKYDFEVCFPKVKTRLRKRENWITGNVKSKRVDVLKLSEICRNGKNKNDKEILKNKKRELKKEIFESKCNYYDKLLETSLNVSKTTWNIINKEIGKNDQQLCSVVQSLPYIKATDCLDIRNVCQLFNDYYTEMVDNDIMPNLKFSHNTKPELSKFPGVMSKFNLSPITYEQLDQILTSFGNKFSAGWDDIPMPIIKQARQYLITPLLHVINSSFISGIFPKKLKKSKIKPCFKQGDPKDFSNYRPLALLSSFSKIFERAMHMQLSKFLNDNDLLDKQQYGFRTGRSVVDAGVDFCESVIGSIESKEKVVGIFLDLTKAFDSVSHDLLLKKLDCIGIRGRAWNWLKSYLVGREQYVAIDHLIDSHLINFTSSANTVNYGVPQGSILGPLLFLIYLTGFPSQIEHPNNICLFADDINIKISGNSNSDLEVSSFINLSTTIQNLHNINLLPNSVKTKFINFSSLRQSSENINIFMDDILLSEAKTIKFLGFHIDNKFNWECHVNSVLKKVSSGLYALRQMSKFSSFKILKNIYHALIESHISFGLCLYGSTSAKNLKSLLVLQKKAIRIIFKLKSKESAKDKFREAGIMTVYSLYIFQIVLYVKSNIEKFPTLNSFHGYSTRKGNQLACSKHSLEIYRKLPSQNGIKFFNHLPIEIKNINSINLFKKHLKKLLQNKPLYTIDEFFL
jgi:hypothetical protein